MSGLDGLGWPTEPIDDEIMSTPHIENKSEIIADMQRARARMLEYTQGSDPWWVAYYDLLRAESRLGERQYGGTERMSQNPPKDVVEVASHDLFSSEELMHLDHAMYYLNSKRLQFFHYLLLKDTRMRNGNPPTKEQIDLARKDSQDCDDLLGKIRKLRQENAKVEETPSHNSENENGN